MGAFIDSLPADTANAAYTPMVLEQVVAGNFDAIQWARITSEIPGHTATFAVFSDALKIEDVRMSVSATLEQSIADVLGCLLMTPRIADLAWQQRTATCLPTPRAITSMKEWMIWDSNAVEEQIKSQPRGLVQTVGKHWVIGTMLQDHPAKACNYGWHFNKVFDGSRWASCRTWPNTDCRVIQDPGTFHDRMHIDYSQSCVLVSRQCLVDGAIRDLADILRDPVLAKLANNEGPLKVIRQPGVPLTACRTGNPVGMGYGEDGTVVCPVDVLNLPGVLGGGQSTLGKTLLAIGGATLAAWAGWEGWKWLRARRYV